MDKFILKPSIDEQILYCREQQQTFQDWLTDYDNQNSEEDPQIHAGMVESTKNLVEMYKAIGENLIAIRMMENVQKKPSAILYPADYPKITTNAEWDALPWIVRIWNQMFSPKKWS